jgi:membrane protease YdiL (CAAX protease family)
MQKDRFSYYNFDWLAALIMVAGFIFSSIAVNGLVLLGMAFFKLNFTLMPIFLMVGNAIIFCTCIAFYDFFMVRPSTKRKLSFNFSPTKLSNYILIFPMMLGMMFIAEFITSQIPTTGPFFGEFYEFFSKLMEQLVDEPLSMFITAVIMAPILEEIVFRGIIQKGMINNGVKPWVAILIASLVFGLVHGNPWQFVGAVLLGIVLGLVYHKTQSLLLPMLLHGFNNFCSTVIIFFVKTESFADAFDISEYTVLSIGILLFAIFLFLFLKFYKSADAQNIQHNI